MKTPIAERYYKSFKNAQGLSLYGHLTWPMPTEEPTDWMPPVKGKLALCKNGYHACRRQDLVHHLGPVICELEFGAKVIDGKDKVVGREARLIRVIDRWNEQKQRLFASDCAEHVLYIFERQCPGDDRPRQIIAATRAYALGEISVSQLAAARNAASNAAWDAAWTARDDAWDAAWAARNAAWTAARAAWNAAWAGAWNAAWAASNAAWNAAWAAARNAAWTARDDAWDAAWAAPGAAAWAAERAWQTERLFGYLEGVSGHENTNS